MNDTSNSANGQRIGFVEFVALMASLIAMVALSIDAMLPALDSIGKELGARDDNQPQLIITLFFVGMALAQLVYGPLSDSFGRKPAIFLGLGIYLAGSGLCLVAGSIPALIVGRIMQGVGAAGPRIVANAIIRDCYEGRRMASVSSLIMMVFIIVPVLAPLIGQAIMALADWHGIFWFFAALGTALTVWTAMRLDETLSSENHKPFRLRPVLSAAYEVLSNRLTIGSTLAMGLVFAAFLSFLSSSQQVLGEAYHLGDLFPLTFSSLAVVAGITAAVNSRLVLRYGMQRLSLIGIVCTMIASVVFCGLSLAVGKPPLWVAYIWLSISFGGIGIIFSNLTALAMEPMGHIAGVASAVIGAISSLIGAVFGTLIANSYNGTAFPIAMGYAVCCALALCVMHWAAHDRVRKRS